MLKKPIILTHSFIQQTSTAYLLGTRHQNIKIKDALPLFKTPQTSWERRRVGSQFQCSGLSVTVEEDRTVRGATDLIQTLEVLGGASLKQC